jgi:hypothetical protein
MDGRGRCMDNIFTERLWRSVKGVLQVYEKGIAASYPGSVEEWGSTIPGGADAYLTRQDPRCR